MLVRAGLGAGAIGLFVLLLPSCSSDGGGGDACSQYYNALVSYTQRCQGTTDTTTVEAQRSDFLQLCSNIVSAPGAQNFAGALSTCASQISSSCSSIECDVQPVGTLADGSACLNDTQCASGACDGDNDACGHCVAAVAVGQPCSASSSHCAKDAYCDTSAGKNVCAAVKRAKQGESCRGTNGDAVTCETGLKCVTPSGGTNSVCLTPGAANAPCDSTGDCQSPLTCSKNVCGDPVPAGGACDNFEGCARGLVCGQDKKCASVVYVAAGQPCDNVHRCANGRCKGTATTNGGDTVTASCEAYLALGAACVDTSSSGSGSEDTPRCSTYAKCISGTCQIPNAATCK